MTSTAVNPPQIAPSRWANKVLFWSGEAYLSYSLGALAYMGFFAAYFVTVNTTAYPEVFYGPVGLNIGAETAEVTVRTWLATSHFVLAVLLLTGHIWHAIQVRAAAAGFDLRRWFKYYGDLESVYRRIYNWWDRWCCICLLLTH